MKVNLCNNLKCQYVTDKSSQLTYLDCAKCLSNLQKNYLVA